MKSYFAKYLPVEGVPQLGDIYLTNRPNYKAGPHLCAGNDGKIVWFQDGAPNVTIYTKLEFAKKVELFLCSRDIQVGDRYYNTDYSIYRIAKSFGNTSPSIVYFDDSTVFDYRKDCIKVIGEFSNESKCFIKEHQEFDKDNIKRVVQSNITGTIWYGDVDQLPITMPQDYKFVYQVKCPWGHFH